MFLSSLAKTCAGAIVHLHTIQEEEGEEEEEEEGEEEACQRSNYCQNRKDRNILAGWEAAIW